MDATGAAELGLFFPGHLGATAERLVLLLADLIGRGPGTTTLAMFPPATPPVWQGARFDDEHGKRAADGAGAREGITRPGHLNVGLH